MKTSFYILQDEGSIDTYLDVKIKQLDDSSFELTQPFLIERVTMFLGIDYGRTHEKLAPVGKPLLNKDLNGIPRKYNWECCKAVGMLTYLTGSVCPDIAMAVHQCACFSVNPMQSHEQTVMQIGCYLLSTKEQGMIYRLDSYTLRLTLMMILLEDGIQEMPSMQTVFTPGLGTSPSMLAVPFIGKTSYKQRLLCPLLRQNILRYLRL
jgi:hypothetical protein